MAHKPLEIDLPMDIPILWLGNAEPPLDVGRRIFRLSDISPELDAWHVFLTGSAGSFALHQLLKDGRLEWAVGDRINIIQYRKFIAPQPIGQLVTNFPGGMYTPNPEQLAALRLGEMFKSIDTPYLLPQPVNIGNIYQHYAACHMAPDILRYTALAIEYGALTPSESIHFLNFPQIIPGGIEFGVLPISFYQENITHLQNICLDFLRNSRPSSMDAYQRRALAFCNERLGSYLVTRSLLLQYNNVVPANLFGYMHTVLDGTEYKGS